MTSLHHRSILSFLCAAILAISTSAQTVTLPQASPAASVGQRIGLTDVTVDYCRPSVRDREIWGALVPWNFVDLGFGSADESPWRAGANENTVFTTSTEIRIEGEKLPAGSYGLFLAVAESGETTVIFSHNHTSWGSYFYDPAEDALRVTVRWEDAPFREQLAYTFSEISDDGAILALEWENKRFPIRLEVDTPEIVMASLKRELRGDKGFVNRSWVNAARYALQHNIELEIALDWIDNALTGSFVGEQSFSGYEVKAQILSQLGRLEEAAAAMDEAVKYGSIFDLHNYGRQLISEGRPQRALEVFELNAEKHPGTWPVNYGLARGYAATGDFDRAVEFLEKAADNLPPGDTINGPAIAKALEAARQGKDFN